MKLNKQNSPNPLEADFSSHDWLSLRKWPAMPRSSHRPLRIADVFSGCGGLSMGALQSCLRYDLTIDIALAADISLDAQNTYRSNLPISTPTLVQAPIETVLDGSLGSKNTKSESDLRNQVGRLDLLLAGPPCQGNSDLNNHSRRADTRNLLYLRAIRAVQVLRPSVAIIENVPPIIHDRHNVLATAIEALSSAKYAVASVDISALSIGLPQKRKRHFLIASRLGLFLTPPHLVATPSSGPRLRDTIFDLVDEADRSQDVFRTASTPNSVNRWRIAYLFDNRLYDLPNKLRPKCHQDGKHSYKSMYGRLKWNLPAQTITSGFGCMGQGRFVHPLRPRTLTPHEAARIQGFPDFFSFATVDRRTSLQELIGNAVPPPLASAIVDAIIHQGLLEIESHATKAA